MKVDGIAPHCIAIRADLVPLVIPHIPHYTFTGKLFFGFRRDHRPTVLWKCTKGQSIRWHRSWQGSWAGGRGWVGG